MEEAPRIRLKRPVIYLIIYLFALSFLPYVFAGELEDSLSTVGTSTSTAPIGLGRKRMFYAENRFWIFYTHTGGYFGYRTSEDGNSWSTLTSISLVAHISSFDIFYDNSTYIHLAYGGGYGYGYYRRGNPNPDGSITWDSTVYFWAGANDIKSCSIIVNSTGYAYISYTNSVGGNIRGYLTCNSVNNGSWSTHTGFPVDLNATKLVSETRLIELENNNLAVLYCNEAGSDYLYCKLYFTENNTLGDQETASAVIMAGSGVVDAFSVVSHGNDTYVAYYVHPTILRFTKRSYYNSTWPTHNETSLDDPSGRAGVALSYDRLNSRIYIVKNSLSNYLNITYYDLAIGGNSTVPVEIVTDQTMDEGFLLISPNLDDFHLQIAFIYPTSTPYTIRHMYLDFTPPAPSLEEHYPIRLAMGLLGLVLIISSPVFTVQQVYKKKNYSFFMTGILLFMIGYALVTGWLQL